MPFLAPIITAATTALGSLASAGGIFGGFLTWLKGGSLLAGIVKAGFAMAANYAIGKLFGPKVTAQAAQLEVTYGDSAPRTAIFGYVGIAGRHVFRNAFGKGNRTVDDVYQLADFRITDVTRAKGDGLWRNVAGSQSVTIPGTEGDIWLRKFYGTMDQTTDGSLVSTSGGRWKSTSKGAGVAYVVARSHLDREGLTTPWDPLFEVKGAPLYDWRKDTSVGGDGPHRWNDQSTWEFTENPVLMMYALERGLYNGTEKMIGKGVSASRLPLAEWTIAANICDELVGASPRYRASLIAGAGPGITHSTNMEPLLEACAASWVEDASGEYPIVGAPQAIVATFTDDDLVVGESFRLSIKRPRVELVNTVSGSFKDPNIFYDDGPIAVRIDAGALAVDGESLPVNLPFKAVRYSDQADRLADIAIRASRYEANAEICLRPKFLSLKPGRWVRWASQKYGTRDFLVISKRLGAMGSGSPRNVYLTLQEIGDGVFDPTAYETVPISPLPPGTPDYQSEVDNILVQPWTLSSEAAGQLPAIRVSFDEILDTTIIAVDFEYWPTEQPTEVQYDTLQMPATVKFLTVGIISNTAYTVRYKLRSDPARSIPYVGPYTVTTPEAAETDITVKFANLSPSIQASIQQSIAQLALIQAKLAQLAAAVTDGTMQATDSRQIAVRFQDATASALTTLSASIEEIDGELVAQAAIISAINATLGTSSAGAFFRMFASAGSGDVIARIDLQVRASVDPEDDGWVTAGTIWEVVDEGSGLFGRIVLAATQTTIMDSGGNVLALFEADGVTIANARIRDLETVNIKTRSIEGDRVVQYGIDTAELQLNSVTYVDSANTSTPTDIDSGVPTSIRQMVMVDDYVSGGVVGAVTVNVDLVAAFGTNNHQLLVVRDSVPTFNSSPTVVAGNVLQVDATMSGTWYWGTAFSDIPPSPGDWYYCIKVGATFGSSNSLNSQSIGIIHAKR